MSTQSKGHGTVDRPHHHVCGCHEPGEGEHVEDHLVLQVEGHVQCIPAERAQAHTGARLGWQAGAAAASGPLSRHPPERALVETPFSATVLSTASLQLSNCYAAHVLRPSASPGSNVADCDKRVDGRGGDEPLSRAAWAFRGANSQQ